MDTRRGKTILFIAADILFILAMAFSGTAPVQAAPNSPFTGQWFGADIDGGDIRLAIGGGPSGPFKITWTEDYIGYCGGTAGIVSGTGQLNAEDSNLLEADLELKCFISGATLDFHVTFRYHPATGMLSSNLNGFVTIWHPAGLPPTYPAMNLRVNYGDNWVESFYEAGHTVWVSVFASDGVTLKATGEFWTEPKDYWGGEPGFQSMDSVWYDGSGDLMPNPPDIRPYDWVYAWADNSANARVQIGDIHGVVDLTTDSIAGTIETPWFSAEVSVECFPWGSPDPATEMKFDSVLPDGADPYACSWAGEWDILDGQPVGVGYFGADGNWVANAFRNPRFTVFPEGNALEGWEWPEDTPVSATIAGKDECAAEATPGYLPDNPWSSFIWISFPEGCDVAAGDAITLASGTTVISHTVRDLAVTEVSPIENWVLGTSAPGANLRVWAHGYDPYTIYTTADEAGKWGVDFDDTGLDLLEGMSGRAQIADELGNATAVDWLAPVTFIVSSTEDLVANDGVCTLREAVIAANTNAPSGDMQGECQAGLDPVADTILLAPGQTYALTRDSTYEDGSLDGDLDVWDNSAGVDLILKADLGGRATISQDAAVDDRVLQNHGAGVRIENLSLSGGNEGGGGGILNHGGLELYAVEVTNNTAGWSGGGIYNTGGAWMQAWNSSIDHNTALNSGGAALTNDGQATLTGCQVTENTGNFDGGAILNTASLVIDSSLLEGNTSTAAGGALANLYDGSVTLQNGSEVRGNSAARTGGGLFNYGMLEVVDSTIDQNTADFGGGISVWAGSVTLRHSLLTANSAPNDGGGIHVTGSGAITIEGGSEVTNNTTDDSGGGLAVWDDGTVVLSDSLFAQNHAGGWGGAIANLSTSTLTIDASAISENSAGDCGGGLANRAGLSITNSTIANNQASWGGGLCIVGGTLTLDASTVSGNASVNDAGGLFIRDAAVVNIQNSSQILNNSANWGGGISSWGSTLTIDASVVSGNSTANSGGGILLHEGGSAVLQNGSRVADNTANWGAGISNWNAALTITDSTLSGNAAVYIGGGLETGGALSVNGSAFLGNTAGGNGDAVWSWTDVPNATAVTNSCLVGNGTIAVFTIQPILQNFTLNWWGDASGPGGSGPGTGDTVGPDIDFADWLSEAPAICALP